ncbi:hypothetical protein ScPMuIL_013352 [Solemya velum]
MASEAIQQMTKSRKIPQKLTLTKDDTKILGRNTERKRERVQTDEQYQTRKLQTYSSRWTPIVHKPSNEQIFKERRDLVSHWYDLWTDTQRKRFLDVLFRQCSRSQYRFVQDWFQERVPLQHLDFTKVLPRFLSLYIFSFLEPKSLSRAAQVCWHWKFLAEQDAVWTPKCLKYGWFLPYTPGDEDYGAWKRHYIGCVKSLDYVTGNGKNMMYGTLADGTSFQSKRSKSASRSGRLSPVSRDRCLSSRPPWQGPDKKPKDLKKSFHAFVHDVNPNDPNMPKSTLIIHNRWGIVKKRHEAALSRSVDFELGLNTSRRKHQHRALTHGEDYDLNQTSKKTLLSETLQMDLENYEERRVRELVNTDWRPTPRTSPRKLTIGLGQTSGQTINWTTQDGKTHLLDTPVSSNPRLVFISSRVPAADLLVDAVMFGVVPIVYEYEGTTVESLTMQVENILQGRHAQSIGLFCHYRNHGEIRLVHGCTVTIETADTPEVREFFETVSNHILPPNMGGQFDVFVPLAASEPGMQLIVELNVLTGMPFSSPTGIIGSYNHINSEWLLPYKEMATPQLYFCQSKLNIWANTAEQVSEALQTCRETLSPFFEKTHKDIVSQLTGQVVFDVIGQTDIRGLRNITSHLVDGLQSLGSQDNVNPMEFLGKFLLERSGAQNISYTAITLHTLTLQEPVIGDEQTKDWREDGTLDNETEDNEEQTTRHRRHKKQAVRQSHVDEEREINETDENESEDEGEQEELDEERDEEKDDDQNEGDMKGKYDGTEKGMRDEEQLKDIANKEKQHREEMTMRTRELSHMFGTTNGCLERLTPEQFSRAPEKRTPIAKEILASEHEYMKVLKAVRNVYFKPLKAALNSNRAIISSQNLQIIFTDLMGLLDISRNTTKDLQNRLSAWDSQNTCLGDIFVRFCTKLKIYSNLINNYEVILSCIERTKEQTPNFRAFLKRHERIPETKMLTLQEMLLVPTCRIGEYVMLLGWFQLHTPHHHQDRDDLDNAISVLKELNSYIVECKLRIQRDRQMIALQKKILHCPALLEANRYLLKHLDVANLRPPMSKTIVPELR